MEKTTIEQHNQLLLNIGTTLLESGAHCGRINRNVRRIADAMGIDTEIFFDYSGMILTTKFKDDPTVTSTHYKKVKGHLVHFDTLADISVFSWKVHDEKLSFNEVAEEFEEISSRPHLPRWQVVLGVGVACASLCIISDGNWIDVLFSFFASMLGLIVRQEITKRRYNIMIAVTAAAFVTSMIVSLNVVYDLGAAPDKALATSVLYLVPGVPLVNSVIDLIEGYVSTSIQRGFYGAFLLLCIAVGMAFSILIFGIHNF
ncbi:threonine/serine exporter ThrE family protein [Haoranjiania flava]|uniref:Threonine/serine exporter family protein n=1 Tax=Haoranjiania flava TaxID=1856322 RepID=A0AAE3LK46_9BACT|nr:threonine/serine exporter family protein [Haoranjiania flava]MCU7694228.1 threonine/serine exporter family protein [Haoranjiania flava]